MADTYIYESPSAQAMGRYLEAVLASYRTSFWYYILLAGGDTPEAARTYLLNEIGIPGKVLDARLTDWKNNRAFLHACGYSDADLGLDLTSLIKYSAVLRRAGFPDISEAKLTQLLNKNTDRLDE